MHVRLVQSVAILQLPTTRHHGSQRNNSYVEHPPVSADVVIMIEADWGEHNFISDSVLSGFDIKFTKTFF